MAGFGFNCVRLPFSVEMVLTDPMLCTPNTTRSCVPRRYTPHLHTPPTAHLQSRRGLALCLMADLAVCPARALTANPTITGHKPINALFVLDTVVGALAAAGVMVILDNHMSARPHAPPHPTSQPQTLGNRPPLNSTESPNLPAS